LDATDEAAHHLHASLQLSHGCIRRLPLKADVATIAMVSTFSMETSLHTSSAKQPTLSPPASGVKECKANGSVAHVYLHPLVGHLLMLEVR